MRACIVGGGLAGSLLAWRLARSAAGWEIDVVAGGRRGADATAASGGAVRAYEVDPEQRRQAVLSLAELRASRTLRQWAGFRQVESVYLRRDRTGPAALAVAVAEIERVLPGSAEPVGAAELERRGWAGVHAGASAVLERLAGYLSPHRLRDAVLADAARRRVAVLDGSVTAVTPCRDGTVECTVDGRRRGYDLVVLAAGAWTPALLQAAGLPAGGLRTKSIQYAVHPAGGWRPSQFVDEVTGLFGRPTADGGLLLGLPTDRWQVHPDRPPTTPALLDSAAGLARARFPRLRLGPAAVRVGAADCYGEPPFLALRPVLDPPHRVLTFSGGAGGSAKTAFAASDRATAQLVGAGPAPEVTPVGRREGQR